MSFVIAAAILVSASGWDAPPAAPVQSGATDPSAARGLAGARSWLGLVDARDWDGSWREAAPIFKGRITAAQWAQTIDPVRRPLGTVATRSFLSVSRAGVLPGAPAGEYEIIQFSTDFAGKPGAIETVTLARDGAAWRVAGYFIR